MNSENHDLVQPKRRQPFLLYLLVLVLITIAAQQGYHFSIIHAQRLDVQARIESLSRLADASNILEPTKNAATERRLAEMRLGFSVPWSMLLAGLEKADQPTIALLAMEPDTKRRTVKLSGEAKTLEALQEYLDKLAATVPFKKTYLLHQEVLAADHLETIGFQLVAVW